MTKKLKIAMPNGGKLAGAAMGKPKDVEVGPHEGILVPESYALSLIENRFAYRCEDDGGMPEKGRRRNKGAPATPDRETGAGAAPGSGADLADDDDGENGDDHGDGAGAADGDQGGES